MAKLSGVKTLDMVGGEITKIAYDGAEYVRVDENAQAGDVVQVVVESWGELELIAPVESRTDLSTGTDAA